ncbi:putative spermidine/putrescine transport system permease protein [Streptosporangium becharense]|uniref:Putative spermidine/putrescine transport system permease protein n=1 Tax=Streptosporangium becharense TaxID=1816182 RepID=A0A7W9MER8_9ACTN|nr:ABC transporter permease subunit [Streptosporangium becharense]MBB2915031.1 putative spermidine/putrescine transport system permease protein [Streptosporangium becharense]MBB5818080.1 putative spermidine/putrescine transport system permease protein [Streptosporangium becharense]
MSVDAPPRAPGTPAAPAGGPGTRPGYRRVRDGVSYGLIAVPFAILFTLLYAWPLANVVLRSLSETGSLDYGNLGFSLANYASLFQDDFLLLIEWRTVLLAVGSTLLTVLVALPVAYFLSRLPRRVAGVLLLLVLIPFWVSIVVRLFALTALLSPNGVVNETSQALGLGELSLLHSFGGTLVGTTCYLLPYMILILYSGMSAVDGNLMLAAKTMGASHGHALRRVYLPQIRPSLVSGTLLVFILGLSFFIVPAILGGPRQSTISTYIQQQIDIFQWGVASAMGVLLLAVTLVLYAGIVRITGRMDPGAAMATQAKGVSAAEPFRWSAGMIAAAAVTAVTLLVLMAPVLLVFPMSVGETSTVVFPPRGFTLDWYGKAFEGRTWTVPLLRSLVVGIGTALLSLVIALSLSRLTQRTRSAAGRALIQALAFAPIITPAILLAIGIYDVELRLGLAGTTVGLVLAHTVIAFPLSFAVVNTALSAADRSLEQAAWTLGASRTRTYWTIVVRRALPAVVGAAAVAFVTSWDEVVLALFLQTGPDKTLPVTIYQYLESGIVPTVPAVASMLIVAVVVVVLITRVRRRRQAQGGGTS